LLFGLFNFNGVDQEVRGSLWMLNCICVRLFCVYVILCLGRGLATS
jgi:hypothetical protein